MKISYHRTEKWMQYYFMGMIQIIWIGRFRIFYGRRER